MKICRYHQLGAYAMRSPRDFGAAGAGANCAPRITSIFVPLENAWNGVADHADLHGLSVDLDTVVLFGGFCSAGSLVESDGGDTDAAASLVVVEKNLLNSTNCGRKVILKKMRRQSTSGRIMKREIEHRHAQMDGNSTGSVRHPGQNL